VTPPSMYSNTTPYCKRNYVTSLRSYFHLAAHAKNALLDQVLWQTRAVVSLKTTYAVKFLFSIRTLRLRYAHGLFYSPPRIFQFATRRFPSSGSESATDSLSYRMSSTALLLRLMRHSLRFHFRQLEPSNQCGIVDAYRSILLEYFSLCGPWLCTSTYKRPRVPSI
jgi:hypothetical protein